MSEIVIALRDIDAATDIKQLHQPLERFATASGFRYFVYYGSLSSYRPNGDSFCINNFPRMWLDRLGKRQNDRSGHLSEQSRLRHVPFAWSEVTIGSHSLSEEISNLVGTKLGMCMSFPVHSIGDTDVLSFLRTNDSHTEWSEAKASSLERTRLFADGMLLAAKVFEWLRAFHNSDINVNLTVREKECLRWVRAGKSSWEISKILGISRHGVLFHIRNAMAKFDVTSRQLAVSRALAQGLI
ncbi:helix-turn-helix transcriptional regulator [Paraburkholderia caribensis]|uniref:helix-turn-helix transcriptional regulator n=1 Tax=Paraburkholderia caribensis TaxID=75105 RepID=UPI00078B945B|nr:LuxR C-terminal-related transcriptional regulator [Paraburkholderia caribensis]AMV41754.1 hypothetical protein ATN79_03525 [Paraburkholderia caribensis]